MKTRLERKTSLKMVSTGLAVATLLLRANSQEGQPCYAKSGGCSPPYDSASYETCGMTGTTPMTCEVGTCDPAPTCCVTGETESGVKCAATQLRTTATTVYHQGISEVDENGHCHCTSLEQQERNGTRDVPVATFDSTGCNPSPYE